STAEDRRDTPLRYRRCSMNGHRCKTTGRPCVETSRTMDSGCVVRTNRGLCRLLVRDQSRVTLNPCQAPFLVVHSDYPTNRHCAEDPPKLEEPKSAFACSPIARIQRIARHRADEQAKRIPWQRLLDTRNEYIDWQEFYLWVRSILETEGRIPNFLLEVLNLRCPGFLDSEKRLSSSAAEMKSIALRLESWIDEHIFGLAKRDGLFHAIT